jgi:hypothetical protein
VFNTVQGLVAYILLLVVVTDADHSGRAVESMNRLLPVEHWIVGSNPTRDIDVCVRLFYVCVIQCVGSGLATG